MLLQLPTEIATAISAYLPNRDMKNLRLTCRAMCAVSQLRLNRVFLSANPRNIDVFWAIAGHEVFRKQIVEIIWDDARLKEDGSRRSRDPESPRYDPNLDYEFDESGSDEDNWDSGDEDEDAGDTPRWFRKACSENVAYLDPRRGNKMDRPDHVARAELVARSSVVRSWRHYRKLLRRQREVLATDADADAFAFGLHRFPALRRVTITAAAHGWRIFEPLYETPMIRAFPPAFNYPLPCWPLEKRMQKPWQISTEDEKDTWRGFRIATRMLAVRNNRDPSSQLQKPGPNITEIVIDVNQLLTGLNAHIFDEECTEQRNLATILQRPNFRRLDLALAVGGLREYGWRPFRSGCLRRTLAAAPDLEHFSFVTDMDGYWVGDDDPAPSEGLYSIPLRDIFPIDGWTHLRHFSLSRFPVCQDALVSFLETLPATIRSLELSFLYFVEGNHHGLVTDMRDKLGWRERPANQRPRLAIGLEASFEPCRGIWADRPVEEFIYHDGPNPFEHGRGNQIPQGWGAVEKDAFDPVYERPYTTLDELLRLGYETRIPDMVYPKEAL